MLILASRLTALLLFGLILPPAAAAGCSRPINVPAAPSGQTVTNAGAQVGGMIPEVMNQLGSRIGCTFVWSPVARARLESMFQMGAADVLVAANEVAERDRAGIFVPVVDTRATLLSVHSERAPVRSMQELLARPELRVALVRGYDYGPHYQAMIAALGAQGRLTMQAHPSIVTRMLAEGIVDVTIMTSLAFVSGLQGDPRTEAIADKVRSEPLDDMPWMRSGIYLSRKSLNPADRVLLEQALTESVKNGTWWEAHKRYYSPQVLNDNLRPLEEPR